MHSAPVQQVFTTANTYDSSNNDRSRLQVQADYTFGSAALQTAPVAVQPAVSAGPLLTDIAHMVPVDDFMRKVWALLDPPAKRALRLTCRAFKQLARSDLISRLTLDPLLPLRWGRILSKHDMEAVCEVALQAAAMQVSRMVLWNPRQLRTLTLEDLLPDANTCSALGQVLQSAKALRTLRLSINRRSRPPRGARVWLYEALSGATQITNLTFGFRGFGTIDSQHDGVDADDERTHTDEVAAGFAVALPCLRALLSLSLGWPTMRQYMWAKKPSAATTHSIPETFVFHGVLDFPCGFDVCTTGRCKSSVALVPIVSTLARSASASK